MKAHLTIVEVSREISLGNPGAVSADDHVETSTPASNVAVTTPRRRHTRLALLSGRAAVALTVPLLIGVAANERALAALAALGALWMVSQDGPDRWELRRPRFIGVALLSSCGIALGTSAGGGAWGRGVVLGTLAATAIVAGCVEASRHAAAGMCLLLGAIVGAGVPSHRSPFIAALVMLGGSAWVFALAAVTDATSRKAAGASAVGEAFAVLSERYLHPGDGRLRRRSIVALNVVEDVLPLGGSIDGPRDLVALQQCAVVAFQLGELSTVLADPGGPLTESIRVQIGGACAAASAALLDRDPLLARTVLSDAHDAFSESLAGPQRRALMVPMPSILRQSPSSKRIAPPPRSERLRFGLQLSCGVVAAALLGAALHGPRACWPPLAVAFIARPDLGPVVQRAAARTIGTLLGVGVAAVLTVTGGATVWLIALCCLMAALLPLAAARSHALAVMCFTPIVFVFISALGPTEQLLMPRVVDTALGALIVLVLDGLAWMQVPSRRPQALFDAARDAAAAYRAATVATPALERHVLRRHALRSVHLGRLRVEEVRREVIARRRDGAVTTEDFAAIERAINDHTRSLLAP